MIEKVSLPLNIPADCHHPGYQSMSARSWWCDECLNQCGNKVSLDTTTRALTDRTLLESISAEWFLFWDWFKPATIVIVGAVLSAMFVLIAYYLQHPLWARDDLATKEMQYKWLTVRRERLLYGIDDVKDELGQAYFYGWSEDVIRLEKSLKNLHHDLDETTTKLKKMEAESLRIEQKNIGTANEDFCLRPEGDIVRSYNASFYWGNPRQS
jgi:hypothetical protein